MRDIALSWPIPNWPSERYAHKTLGTSSASGKKQTKASCSTLGCGFIVLDGSPLMFKASLLEKKNGMQKKHNSRNTECENGCSSTSRKKTSIQPTLQHLLKQVAAPDTPTQAVALRTMSASRSDGSRFCWFSRNLLTVDSAKKNTRYNPWTLRP